MKTNALATFAIGAVLILSVGCETSNGVVVDPPAPDLSSESDSETATDPATTEAIAAEAEQESQEDVPADQRGLDDEPLPEGLSTTADRALLEALPTIAELAALSPETTIDEKTKVPFTKLGDFAIRDGVYVFRMVSIDGMRELIMTVETQANGFLVRRGDRTKLRFVVDGDKATFASEPGSGEIAGRGAASGDDWAKGSFRVKNDDGTTSEGTFELRKLQDPKTPRAERTAPAGPAEAPAADAKEPVVGESAPIAEAPED